MRRNASVWAVSLLCGVLVTSLGCRQLAGIEEHEARVADAGPDAAEPGDCPNVFAFPAALACHTCLQDSCCLEMAACQADPGCLDCTHARTCATPPAFEALQKCVAGACKDDCVPDTDVLDETLSCVSDLGSASGACVLVPDDVPSGIHCNPVTNAPCNPDAVCAGDIGVGVLDCRVVGYGRDLCEHCGLVEGLCGPKLVCVDGQCARWCCEDADCADDGAAVCRSLNGEIGLGDLGVCVEAR